MPRLLESQFGTGSNKPNKWSPDHLGKRREKTYALAQAAKDWLLSNLIDIEPEESPQIWVKNPPKHQAFFFEPLTSCLIAIGSEDAYNPQSKGLQIKVFQNEPGKYGYTGPLTSFSTSSNPTRVGEKETKHLARFSLDKLVTITSLILVSSPIALEDFNQRMQPVLLEIDRQQETLELIMSEAILDH